MKSPPVLGRTVFALWLALMAAAPALWPQSPLHQRYSSFWTTEEGYESTIELHNNVINEALVVTPVLTTEDGTAVTLDPVTMPPLGSVSIPVREALAAKGLTAPARGSAVFRYNRKAGGALAAETSVIGARDSLAYTIPSAETAPRSRTLWGFYWLRSPASEVYVALQNISGEAVEVTPRLRIGGAWFALAPEPLAPGGSKVLEFPGDFDPSNLALARAWQEQPLGGIELAHGGAEGALNVSGWVEDERLGYSNMTSFGGPPRGTKLFGTQVLLGKQEDLLGQRRGLQLNTELLLWNTGGQALAPAGTFYYESYGNVIAVALPLGTLAAGEIRYLDLSGLQKQGLIPAGVTEGSLEIEHGGPEGALTGRVVSISQDDKYGLYTSLEDHGAGSISGVYWSLRDDWNSILTVMNAGDGEETVTVELAYNGGTFVLPEFVLQPRQSKTLNLRKLVAEGVVDRDGNPFPEGADHGGYLVYSSGQPLKAKLVVKEHLVSQRLEVAAPFYQTCNWVQSFFLSDASPVSFPVFHTRTVYPQCEMSTGHIYGDSEANLFSTDTSIISVGGTGTSRLVTALAPGVAEVDGDTFEPGDEFCTEYVFLLVAAKQVTVLPQQYTVTASSFIPTNYAKGDVCGLLMTDLAYKGDERGYSRTHPSFRTRTIVGAQIPPAMASSSKQTGQSRAYAWDAIENNGQIGPEDEDGIAEDCVLFHKAATAYTSKMQTSVGGSLSNAVIVNINGEAGNPIPMWSPEINWDYSVTINGSAPQTAASYSISGSHDCYPAHDVWIDNTQVWGFTPFVDPNSRLDIVSCLLGVVPVPVTGQGTLP